MPGCMRYPDSGGLSAVGRVRREMVRLEAAGMFEQDVSPVEVAQRLRVSAKSAYQWRRRWRSAAWGWGEDPRWTLARVATLVGRLFHVRYTPRGTSYLLD